MKTPVRKLLFWIMEIGVIGAIHFILLDWLAEKNVVATIFAAGTHVPRLTLACAGAFMAIRLLALLLLPGIILSRAGMYVVDLRMKKNDTPATKE